jgi:hypothetical protein
VITAATLKAARDALANLSPTYWFNELAITDDGMLTQPNHPTYYLIRLTVDPAVGDLDGEAYSRPVLTVQAWSTQRGAEFAARDSAVTALDALGWERLNTQQVPGDGVRYGLTTDLVLTS